MVSSEKMTKAISPGDCVRVPDGRIGRVRDNSGGKFKVRVRRKTSDTHQFLYFTGEELKPADCPEGWMSPAGYNRYLKTTLAKMRKRQASKPR